MVQQLMLQERLDAAKSPTMPAKQEPKCCWHVELPVEQQKAYVKT
jgi:hypothetical protein